MGGGGGGTFFRARLEDDAPLFEEAERFVVPDEPLLGLDAGFFAWEPDRDEEPERFVVPPERPDADVFFCAIC